jgi:hypothetical protein
MQQAIALPCLFTSNAVYMHAKMLALSYAFDSSLQAMLSASLLQRLLFSIPFMPVCKQRGLYGFILGNSWL